MLKVLNLITGGSSGGVLVSGTTVTNISADIIVANEDAVIEELKIGTTDVVTARGLAAKTLTTGTFIGSGMKMEGNQKVKFTQIKLTSGSVMVY